MLRTTSRSAMRIAAVTAALAYAPAAFAQGGRLTSPKEQFGYDIGADYVLPNYTQFVAYYQKLAGQSDRMRLDTIGMSAEGRPQLMAIISSPENLKHLDRYKEIARKLARAEGVSEAEAQAMAKEGKAIVWIDGGLHASEVLGANQLIETTWQLLSRTDAETMRILNDCVILAVHANPDGMQLVADWYMRNPETTKRSTNGLPRLYQKYIGHDNNRDFYIANQPESTNMNRVLYLEWFPQIVYNHHQTGPAGTVMFAPPFRDPFNYNFDPLIPIKIDQVGSAMHARFIAENKPGVTMRSGSSYSTWWNGGLRTMVYFHNMVGLLTETIGNPTPITIPLVPANQLPRADLPFPIAPQPWHFRQSIDYSITANWAVLDFASRYKEHLLEDIWRMGQNSIQRGSTDSWTVTPHEIDKLSAVASRDRATNGNPAASGRGRRDAAEAPLAGAPGATPNPSAGSGQAAAPGGNDRTSLALNPFGGSVPTRYYQEILRDPALRDPRGYILPADQPDFPTATKFINTLIKAGVTVHKATAAFTVNGKQYPAGSWVVKSAQAFRPHILDMFEPQDHPNDIPYPGGPPKPPYDNAGYTLAMQMGVKYDRILEAFDGPFQPITGTLQNPMAGTVARASGAKGFFLSHQANDAFRAVNRLLAKGEEVYMVKGATTANGKTYNAGTFYIAAKGTTLPVIQRAATELGVSFDGVSSKPSGAMTRVRPARIALWDQYGGSMPSGHQRWLLEQFEFPFTVVYPQDLDAGNLKAKYDVIILPGGAVPMRDRAAQPTGDEEGFGGQPRAEDVPAEFRNRLGNVTVAKTVPLLKEFLEQGGTVLAIGSSTNLGYHLGLPITNALVDSATGRPLPRERYYIPGSLLEVSLDTAASPIVTGVGSDGKVDVFFDNSPVFKLGADAAQRGVKRLAWFADGSPLRSGWAWGQQYLAGGTEIVEAPVGKGRLVLFGPEITFRAQPHGTFKFLFNGLYVTE